MKGAPALLIKRERTLVVGDLHIGMHLKLREKGLYFQKATEKMSANLLEIYKKSGARRLVLLGDVKESIASPRFAEYRELRLFFEALRGVEIMIAKGNHDGGLDRVLANMGFGVPVEREVFVGDVALTHGNSWPSPEVMRKRYLIVGHGHYAMMKNGAREKVYVAAGLSKQATRRYKVFNKLLKLIVMPAFNSLITGSALREEARGYLPVLKDGLFDFDSAKVYGLDGKLRGSVGEIIRPAD